MMKRVFAILLALCVLMSLTACKKDKEAEKEPEGPKTTLELLKSAGEKLRNADAFQMDMWHWSMNTSVAEPEPFAMDSNAAVKLYEMQYISDLDGAPASYLKTWKWTRPNEEPQVEEWHYFGDKIGYGGQGSDKNDNNYKHFSENGFTAKQRFWMLGFALDIEKDTLFTEFCALEPTVTTAEDGTTTIEARVNYEQMQSLLNVDLPMWTSHRADVTGQTSALSFVVPNGEKVLSLEFIIDSEGYLSHIGVKRWYRPNDGTEYNKVGAARMISFSCISEKMELDVSDISKDYLKDPEQEHIFVHHYKDDYQAIYLYDAEENVYDYNHIRKNMEKFLRKYDVEQGRFTSVFDAVTPAYRLLTEVDGRLVQTEYTLDSYFGSGDLNEQLIIPKGMTFNYGYSLGGEGAYRRLEKVYFEDSEENAKIAVTCVFYTSASHDSQRTELTLEEAEAYWGEIPEVVELEKFYYAEQWEYVNGVPTVKQS